MKWPTEQTSSEPDKGKNQREIKNKHYHLEYKYNDKNMKNYDETKGYC